MEKERKNRPGLDIAFSLPKGQSVTAYYAAEPDVDAEHSSQWGGTFAALRGISGDAVAETMEQIEAAVTTHTRQSGERSGRVKGQQVWMGVTHRILPPRSRKSNESYSNVLSPLDYEDIDVAISEVLALMPKDTCSEDKGSFVREMLYKWGYRIMRED